VHSIHDLARLSPSLLSPLSSNPGPWISPRPAKTHGSPAHQDADAHVQSRNVVASSMLPEDSPEDTLYRSSKSHRQSQERTLARTTVGFMAWLGSR